MAVPVFVQTLRHLLHPLRREWRARVSYPARVFGTRLRLRAWAGLGRSVPVDVDGLRLQLVAQGAIAEEVCRDGAFEPHEIRLVLRLLGPGQTFLDIGANVGLFALAAAKRFPDARVIAFEPSASTFRTLEWNLRLNALPNVRAVRAALADYVGEAQMHLNAPGKDGLNTLGEPTHPACRVVSTETVPVTTLDTFLAAEGVQRVHVIKVDVEGAELLVFRGARALLESDAAPILFYEGSPLATAGFGYEPPAITRLLQGCGYRLFALSEEDGRLVALTTEQPRSAMTLAVKPEHVVLSPWLAETLGAELIPSG